MCRQRGANADDGTFAGKGIDDHRPAGTGRFGHLRSPHRHIDLLHVATRQIEAAVELGLTLVLKRGLVALHARAGSAGENQSIDRRD
jgi:hypothetical protein